MLFCPKDKQPLCEHEIGTTSGGRIINAYCKCGFMMTSAVLSEPQKQEIKQEVNLDWDLIHRMAKE